MPSDVENIKKPGKKNINSHNPSESSKKQRTNDKRKEKNNGNNNNFSEKENLLKTCRERRSHQLHNFKGVPANHRKSEENHSENHSSFSHFEKLYLNETSHHDQIRKHTTHMRLPLVGRLSESLQEEACEAEESCNEIERIEKELERKKKLKNVQPCNKQGHLKLNNVNLIIDENMVSTKHIFFGNSGYGNQEVEQEDKRNYHHNHHHNHHHNFEKKEKKETNTKNTQQRNSLTNNNNNNNIILNNNKFPNLNNNEEINEKNLKENNNNIKSSNKNNNSIPIAVKVPTILLKQKLHTTSDEINKLKNHEDGNPTNSICLKKYRLFRHSKHKYKNVSSESIHEMIKKYHDRRYKTLSAKEELFEFKVKGHFQKINSPLQSIERNVVREELLVEEKNHNLVTDDVDVDDVVDDVDVSKENNCTNITANDDYQQEQCSNKYNNHRLFKLLSKRKELQLLEKQQNDDQFNKKDKENDGDDDNIYDNVNVNVDVVNDNLKKEEQNKKDKNNNKEKTIIINSEITKELEKENYDGGGDDDETHHHQQPQQQRQQRQHNNPIRILTEGDNNINNETAMNVSSPKCFVSHKIKKSSHELYLPPTLTPHKEPREELLFLECESNRLYEKKRKEKKKAILVESLTELKKIATKNIKKKQSEKNKKFMIDTENNNNNFKKTNTFEEEFTPW